METGYRMKTTSRRDYLQKIYQRYRRAGKEEKRRILDEFCSNCGYHRKYAIRLLNGACRVASCTYWPMMRFRTNLRKNHD